VSTGGFAKDAHYEAEASAQRTFVPLPVRLLVDQYKKFDAETRALVPLKKLRCKAGSLRRYGPTP
jgi:restriction system protein